MESLRISALFSLICTVVACGCGGCNYASDLACARCCTAYVRRAANLLTSTLDNWHDRILPARSNFLPDALPIRYLLQPRFSMRSALKSSPHLQTPPDDGTSVFDFISKASEWRRFMNSKSADTEDAIEIYNYLDSLRSFNEKPSVAKRSKPMPSRAERMANNAQREQSALQAIVQEINN